LLVLSENTEQKQDCLRIKGQESELAKVLLFILGIQVQKVGPLGIIEDFWG